MTESRIAASRILTSSPPPSSAESHSLAKSSWGGLRHCSTAATNDAEYLIRSPRPSWDSPAATRKRRSSPAKSSSVGRRSIYTPLYVEDGVMAAEGRYRSADRTVTSRKHGAVQQHPDRGDRSAEADEPQWSERIRQSPSNSPIRTSLTNDRQAS